MVKKGENGKDFRKIKLTIDDNLSLNKPLKLHLLIITLRCIFEEDKASASKCHDVLMTTYKFKNIAILNVKGVDFRWILWGISRDEAVNRLSNSALENKGVL